MKDYITSYDSLYESMMKCKKGVTWKPSVKSFVLNGEESINEQNPRAVGFYEYMGVETYKRTDLDEEGNTYPLL